jgi:hypothetical protein
MLTRALAFETFTGINNALTTSNRINKQSLKRILSDLDAATLKTEVTMAGLSQTIERSNNNLKLNLKMAHGEASAAITSVSDRNGDEFTRLADRLSVYEKTPRMHSRCPQTFLRIIGNSTCRWNRFFNGG